MYGMAFYYIFNYAYKKKCDVLAWHFMKIYDHFCGYLT